MFIEMRIEVMSQININDLDTFLPLNWTMSTVPVRLSGSIVFDVPMHELRRIPYPIGTTLRLVPKTNRLLQPLRPSRWFAAGLDVHPGTNFNIHCDENGFHQIHYTLSESEYEELMLDAFMAYDILVAVPTLDDAGNVDEDTRD
jgi:hypothetical protein